MTVALYDPETRLGSLGNMLLPDQPDDRPVGAESNQVDAGIRQIVIALIYA